MKYAVVILLAFVFTSCNTDHKTGSADAQTDSAVLLTQEKTLCFLRLEGASKRDSSIIHIKINGDSIDGTFNHLPYEKDSRKGTIAGTRKDDTIRALWSFMQEGMNDTISVEFLIKDDALYQKTFGFDKNTGRQKLTDTSTFSIKYRAVDCPSS
ncbi:hypothetical protein ACFSJU_14130 [Paradesertivirga mongoliensis]|uniref:Uncharacterized protein n=1 Tax=Paradesertivirga mongoliensis TaxID=2100740 RepID=A0ABW4ZN20_9SPHI|nr:hypothetical protein [Pedobacter mongoliensis]